MEKLDSVMDYIFREFECEEEDVYQDGLMDALLLCDNLLASHGFYAR